MFCEYTLTVTFFDGSCTFQCSNQLVFAPSVSSGGEDQGFDELYGMLMMMNYFLVWLTNERRLALFPGCTIVRDPHHLESLTSCKQDWNQSSDFVE